MIVSNITATKYRRLATQISSNVYGKSVIAWTIIIVYKLLHYLMRKVSNDPVCSFGGFIVLVYLDVPMQ